MTDSDETTGVLTRKAGIGWAVFTLWRAPAMQPGKSAYLSSTAQEGGGELVLVGGLMLRLSRRRKLPLLVLV